MTYTYECSACSNEFDIFQRWSEYTPTHPCPTCGQPSLRVFKPGHLPQLSTFDAFVTADLTGTPVEITSRRQEMDLCRRHNRIPTTAEDRSGLRRPKVELPPIQDDYNRLKQKVGIPSGDRAFDLIQGKK